MAKILYTNSLNHVAASALPALSGSTLVYNAERNIYLTNLYTSMAGNKYYKAVRFSDRLAVFYHIGEGYCRNFLNGITIFCWDGHRAKMIAQKYWGGCDNWHGFSESDAKRQSILMVKDYLAGQMKLQGAYVTDSQLYDYAERLIAETHQKQLR